MSTKPKQGRPKESCKKKFVRKHEHYSQASRGRSHYKNKGTKYHKQQQYETLKLKNENMQNEL